MRRINKKYAELRAVQIRLQDAAERIAEEIDSIDQQIVALEPNAIGEEAAARVTVENPDDATEQLAERLARGSEARRRANVILESLID